MLVLSMPTALLAGQDASEPVVGLPIYIQEDLSEFDGVRQYPGDSDFGGVAGNYQ